MKRKEPADEVVAFFESASPDTARAVLAIIQGIIRRKTPEDQGRRRKPNGPAGRPAAAHPAPVHREVET